MEDHSYGNYEEAVKIKNPHISTWKSFNMTVGDLLEKYSMWLCKHGYMDTDWKDEEPKAIDEFLKTLK